MDGIEAALDSLKLLKPGEKPNYVQVAKKYSCNCSTLLKRYRGVQGTYAEQYENQRLLNPTQENELVQYINRLCARGLPPLRQIIRNFATEIGSRQASRT